MSDELALVVTTGEGARMIEYDGYLKAQIGQEEIDLLVSHATRETIYTPAVYSAIRKLPDSECGSGGVPADTTVACMKCDDEIEEGDEYTERYGNYYHADCAREAQQAVIEGLSDAEPARGVEDGGQR